LTLGWSLWSKDIIILFPPDSRTGTQAWVDAYHDAHDPQYVTPLPLKSGALQGALALDFPLEQRFSALQVIYDGVNGQLPNLDLVNSVGNIASGQMGIHSFIQSNRGHNGKYKHRLKTMLRGMLKQGVGYGAGAHSSFIPYHVDAVTVQPFGKGPHDEMAMGRVIEGSFRSLNNLLEHLHQSFFFYLLMQRDRFVSIGTYLPSAMLLAANFSIMAISLWVKSGQSAESKDGKEGEEEKKKKKAKSSPVASPPSSERSIASPAAVVLACHALAAIPLSLFNHLPADVSEPSIKPRVVRQT
jgi:GPI-anchor transamidase subunit GAA1